MKSIALDDYEIIKIISKFDTKNLDSFNILAFFVTTLQTIYVHEFNDNKYKGYIELLKLVKTEILSSKDDKMIADYTIVIQILEKTLDEIKNKYDKA